jgi:hypothetical protein
MLTWLIMLLSRGVKGLGFLDRAGGACVRRQCAARPSGRAVVFVWGTVMAARLLKLMGVRSLS